MFQGEFTFNPSRIAPNMSGFPRLELVIPEVAIPSSLCQPPPEPRKMARRRRKIAVSANRMCYAATTRTVHISGEAKAIAITPSYAGKYILGPEQGNSPVKCLKSYLGVQQQTTDFFVIKVLTLKDEDEPKTMDDINGIVLFHTEHTLLSQIGKQVPGVIQSHDMFGETVTLPVINATGDVIFKPVKRLYMVLDCYMWHNFNEKYSGITSLQMYIKQEHHISEPEALQIFYELAQIVKKLHTLKIVHRDIRLSNVILDMTTRKVKLVNFNFGAIVPSGDEDFQTKLLLSPEYQCPEIIMGKPYFAKPAEMWGMGVILYAMLVGQYPFYDRYPVELHQKIANGHFTIPTGLLLSPHTVELVQALMFPNPRVRLTASEAVQHVESYTTEVDLDKLTPVQDLSKMQEVLLLNEPEPVELQMTSLMDYIVYTMNEQNDSEATSSKSKGMKRKKQRPVNPPLPNSGNSKILEQRQLDKINYVVSVATAKFVAHKVMEATDGGTYSPLGVLEDLSVYLGSTLKLLRATYNIPDDKPK